MTGLFLILVGCVIVAIGLAVLLMWVLWSYTWGVTFLAVLGSILLAALFCVVAIGLVRWMTEGMKP